MKKQNKQNKNSNLNLNSNPNLNPNSNSKILLIIALIILTVFLFEFIIQPSGKQAFQSTAFGEVNITIAELGPGVGRGGGAGPRVQKKIIGPPGLSFSVEPDSIYIKLKKGEEKIFQITVQSETDITMLYQIKSTLSILNFKKDKIEISPREKGFFNIDIDSEKEGIFTGILILSSEFFEREIPVIIEISSESTLKANLEIPYEFSIIPPASNLFFKLNIENNEISLVDIDYIIKDSRNKILYQDSETLSISKPVEIEKTIKIPHLKQGTYILGVILKHKDKIFVASSPFKVLSSAPATQEYPTVISKDTTLLLIIIILFLILIHFVQHKNK